MPPVRRLAFVVHELHSWGGHDRSTLEIAKRLSRRWGVDVYSFRLEDEAGMDGWGDVRFHRIRPDLRHPALLRFTWFFGASWLSLRLGARGGRPPLRHATGACSLVSDVVQVQFVNAEWARRARSLPPRLFRHPRARGGGLSAALDAYHRVLLGYNVAVERRLYSRDKTYIAIADGVRRELETHFGLEGRVRVIRHGVDANAFRPAESEADRAGRAALRARLGIGEDEIVFLLVGAFERKGLAVAIEALAALPAEARRRARLLAVGEGGADAFKARAAELGVGDRLTLAGPTREVAAWYRAADAFVLPTFYEPFGLVILEAMASGLAPVVSADSGAAELIRDGESGILLADPRDPRQAAAALERILRQDGLRRGLGARARDAARARSWDVVAGEYAEVLGPLLEGGPG
jgi:UDP-glucose:(heptosyl)LPS alpha-1,3-glucosyltransferase